MKGEIFLHGGAGSHVGDETIVDVMNENVPFFPLRLGEPEAMTVLVAKAHVRYMFVPSLASDPRIVLAREAAVRLEVVVEMGDDESHIGILYADVPPGKRRTLDYINVPGNTFLVLVQEGKDCLINRAHIQLLRDHNPAIDDPLPE